MNQTCPLCDRTLPEYHFAGSVCRRCIANRMNSKGARRSHNRRELAQRVYDYLTENACEQCGEADVLKLQFDHVCGDKTATISNMVSSCIPWERIEEEIGKCRVLCANCHQARTARQFAWIKLELGVADMLATEALDDID